MKRRGFTLIEVLVATAILALIVSSVYFSFTNLIEGRTRIRDRAEGQRRVYFALDLMRRDIQNAYLTRNRGIPEETHITIFRGLEDSPVSHLTFASLNHIKMRAGGKECDQAEIEYYGDTIEGKSTLMRRESSWVDGFPERGGNVFPILDDFKEITFEYWDADNREWRSSWDSEGTDRADILPPKVKITMAIKDADGEKKEFRVESVVNIKMQKPFTF
jgi:type II secretion system protein J